MRGRLAEVPQSPEDTEIDTIRARVEVVGEGLLPTQAYANLDNNAFLPLDLGKNLYPFGKEPKVDCILYLACDELLQTADAYISIEMLLADSSVIPRPNPTRAARARVRVLGRQALASPRPLGAARRAARRRRRARLPRRHQGAVAVRHGQLPPPEGHGGARDQRRREALDPRPHREGRLRRAGHVHAREREVDLQGRPPAAAAGAALDHVPLSRGLSRRRATCCRSTTSSTPTSPRSRAPSSRSSSRSRPSPRSRRRCTSASPRKPPNDPLGLYFQLDEELGLGSLPTDEAEVATTELDKYETMRRLVVGERPARGVGVLGRSRLGAAVGRRRDPGLHEQRASRSSSRPTTG